MNNLKSKRFSKSLVTEYILEQINRLVDEYDFDDNIGWSQVEGLSEEKNRAYGEFRVLHDLLDFINI